MSSSALLEMRLLEELCKWMSCMSEKVVVAGFLAARGVIGVIALVITFTQLSVAQNTERLINLSHLLLITTFVRVMLTS